MSDRDTWELIEGAQPATVNGKPGMRWRPQHPLIVEVSKALREPIGHLVSGVGAVAAQWSRR